MAKWAICVSVYQDDEGRFFFGLGRNEKQGDAPNRLSVQKFEIEIPDGMQPLANWMKEEA